jgi:hypothetical protein
MLRRVGRVLNDDSEVLGAVINRVSRISELETKSVASVASYG